MTDPAPVAIHRQYRYYDLVMAAFVCSLLCSDIIGVRKVTHVGWNGKELFAFGAGNLFFPIAYLFGDILTEVYGYARSRRVVWAGFAALAFASLQSFVIVQLPPANEFHDQVQLEWAFGSTWRIALGSLIAYFCGEFVNSFTLAKLKILTEGRMLWTRTIGSTIAGEAVDSVIFYPLAFYGESWMPDALLVKIMIANYCIKVGWEVVATPLTYRVVAFFKRAEHEDYYDRGTNFTPFSLKV
ncbi:MAG TPA: queuosine precursor transporter [Polyangiaceae bacterium]|nr:queuosine precursor transporter [Polyangiaceae bacterium]